MRQERIVQFLRRESNTARAKTADLVVAASYACLKDDLADGTRESLKLAMKFHQLDSRAVLAFCNCAHSGFEGCVETELRLKLEMLGDRPYLCGGGVDNSIQEAEAVREACRARGFLPKRILIICGEIHSRSIWLVWTWAFPEAEIIIRCISYQYEYQPDHPFPVEREFGSYVRMSLKREAAFRLTPIGWWRNYHH